MIKHTRLSYLILPILLALLAVASVVCRLEKHRQHTTAGPPSQATTTADEMAKLQAGEALGRLPLSFEANQGQCEWPADFLARGPGYNLFLTATEASLALQRNKFDDRRDRSDGPEGELSAGFFSRSAAATWLNMRLKGANRAARARGLAKLPGRSNYLLGHDAGRWRTGIAQFRQVRYDDVYPGVDVIYYGAEGQLEYDFVVAPHADPRTIRLAFAGAERVSVSEDGELVLRAAGAEVRQPKPIIYQEADGARQWVEGGYVQTGGREIGFAVAAYDRDRPLVIDPVILYASFLGGGSYDADLAITLDAANNVYVMGRTTSANFPVTAQALKKTSAAQQTDIFISKLNPAGTALIYSTYLGSDSGEDEAYDFAVDAAGNVYLTGRTFAANFPLTPNAAQTSFTGGNEAFVAKLNATGSALLYSTLFGGNNLDEGRGIAVDAANNFYVAGHTASSNFPTTAGAFQRAIGTPLGNAFIAMFTAAGAVTYATCYGGGNLTYGNAIAADNAGNAFVAGDEGSAGRNMTDRIFVLKLNPGGSQLLFNFSPATAAGNVTNATDLLLDGGGNLYVTGYTTGGLTATMGAYQRDRRGGVDAYVLKLDAAGALTYLTYLGGSEADSSARLALDSVGNIYVVGWTISPDFPALNAPQSRYGGGGLPFGDGFITKLNAAGSVLLYSTFLGESGNDYVNDIAVDGAGNAYVVGGTDRGAFPVTPGAVQISLGGPADAFVAKIGEGSAGLVNASAASYLRGSIAQEAIVAAFGPELALATQAADATPLPTSLAGTSVTVKDSAGVERLAPLFFVSPNQINYQTPPGAAPGTALVSVRNANGARADGVSFIERIAPALFTANANGQGAPAALALRVKANGAQTYEAIAVFDPATNRFVPRPLDFGQDDLYLILFGSGLRFRSQLSAVQVQLQNIFEPALFAGAQGGFVGLDQVNVRLPKSLAGRGETGVIVRAEGTASNEVRVSFR